MHGFEQKQLHRLVFAGLTSLCAAIFLLAACTPSQNPNSPAEGTAVPQVTSGTGPSETSTLETPTTESGTGDQTPQATSATNADLTSVPGDMTTPMTGTMPMTGTTTTDTGTPQATTTSNP